MANRGRPRKNKEVPLSKESEVLVKKGLHEAKEGKIESNPLLEERKNKLNLVLRELNKNLDSATINYANTIEARERLSFGYKSLDKITGGGIPYGTYTTIWGSKGVGKSTIAYKLIATSQQAGKIAAYIDMERSYDEIWAKKYGVNVEELVYISAHTAEEVLDVVIKLCKEKVCDLIVLDSLHGMSPKDEMTEGKAEKDRSVSDSSMALLARKLSQFFRMATSYVADAKCAVLLIGQSRTDLGSFIKCEVLSGGHALAHNSRLILKMRRGQKADAPFETIKIENKNEKHQIGFDCVIVVEKSQINNCIEGSDLHVPFIYLEGIDEKEK